MHLDRRLIGWGLIFILVGAVPLAVNGGALDRDLVSRWPELWPLLIIALGLSLVLARTPGHWVGSISAAIVVGLMGGGLVATGLTGIPPMTGCGGTSTADPFQTQTGTLGATARMNVEFNCGTLNVTTAAGSAWQLSGNDGDGRTPIVQASSDAVTIKPINDNGGFFKRGKVVWNLTVPQAPNLDLGFTLNAGEGKVDLGLATVASFNATVNAGSFDAILGANPASNAVNMTVNAGSATVTSGATSGTYNLSVNAGSLDVCLPQGSVVRVHWSGTLASHDLDGLGLVKVDEHTWTSTGFSESQAHVELDVSANAGSFSLGFGGGCSGS
jgi:cell wall-active antibiotic response 4TMS protein YvqF